MKKLILLFIIVCCFTISASAWVPTITVSGTGVIGDGEIGATDFDDTYGVAANIYYSDFTPTTAGNVRYIRFYGLENDGGSSTACLGLHSSDGTLLDSCTINFDSVTPAWRHCDMGAETKLSGGVTYLLSIGESTGDLITYDTTTGTHIDYDSGQTCGNNIDSDDGNVKEGKVAIHADNTNQAAP
jgi:hypothetical protein